MKKVHRDLINAAIAGGLVLCGSFINGGIEIDGIIGAFAASVLAFLYNYKESLNKKGQKNILHFI